MKKKFIAFLKLSVCLLALACGETAAQDTSSLSVEELTPGGLTLFYNQRIFITAPKGFSLQLESSAKDFFTVRDTARVTSNNERIWELITRATPPDPPPAAAPGAPLPEPPRLLDRSGAELANKIALFDGIPIFLEPVPELRLGHLSLSSFDGVRSIAELVIPDRRNWAKFNFAPRSGSGRVIKTDNANLNVSAIKTGFAEIEVKPIRGEFVKPMFAQINVQVPSITVAAEPEMTACDQLKELAGKTRELSKANYDIRAKELSEACSKEEESNIAAMPTFLTFNEVKDNFGRRIARQYVVVEVNVVNKSEDKQFVLQNITIGFDPRRCDAIADLYSIDRKELEFNYVIPKKIKKEQAEQFAKIRPLPHESKSREEFVENSVANCFNSFEDFFRYSVAYQSSDRDTVLGVGETGRIKNPRSNIINGIQFMASVGSALSGLNLLGKDGVKGFALLGGTFLDSTKSILPDQIAAQYMNLTERTLPDSALVEVKNHKVISIFIPIPKLFSKDEWKLYKSGIGNERTTELQRIAQLTVIASADGVFVSAQNNRPVSSRPVAPTIFGPTPLPTPR